MQKVTDPDAISAHVPAEADLLPWLIEQDTDTLLAMLAPLVARGIDAGLQDWTLRAEPTVTRRSLRKSRCWTCGLMESRRGEPSRLRAENLDQ